METTNDKFLYIKESQDEGTLLAQDGGMGVIWHNQEHIVGMCYPVRIKADDLRSGFEYASKQVFEEGSSCSMFDFEEEHEVHPLHLIDMADWLVSPRGGDFMENLTVIDEKDLTEKELEEKIVEFFNNDIFKANEKDDLVNAVFNKVYSKEATLRDTQRILKHLSVLSIEELRAEL